MKVVLLCLTIVASVSGFVAQLTPHRTLSHQHVSASHPTIAMAAAKRKPPPRPKANVQAAQRRAEAEKAAAKAKASRLAKASRMASERTSKIAAVKAANERRRAAVRRGQLTRKGTDGDGEALAALGIGGISVLALSTVAKGAATVSAAANAVPIVVGSTALTVAGAVLALPSRSARPATHGSHDHDCTAAYVPA